MGGRSAIRLTTGGAQLLIDAHQVCNQPATEGSVVRNLLYGQFGRKFSFNSGAALDRDGVLWRFLADPIHLDRGWPRTIGWAEARYLEPREGPHPGQELETVALDPIPHAEFPDDIALIPPNIEL